MIRGVNKNVIEISDTGHECFERAILFVRQSGPNQSAEFLSGCAREYLAGLRLRPGFYKRARLWQTAVKLTAAAAGGAAVTAALLLR